MRSNRWAALLLGSVLLGAGSGCADRGEDGTEPGTDTLEVEADESLDRVGEAMNEAVDRTGQAVGEAMEETGRAIGDAAEGTGAAVGRAVEETGRAIERAGAEVKEESAGESGADSL